MRNGWLVLLLFLSSCFGPETKIKGKPVLEINGTAISAQEFAEYLAKDLRPYDALSVKDDSVLLRAKDKAVNYFILRTLAHGYAKEKNLLVTPQELDAEVRRLVSHYPDENSLRRSLAQENVSYEKWREDIAFSLLQKKIQTQIQATVPEPSEKELRDYYDSHKLEFQRSARLQIRQIVLDKEDNAKRVWTELQSGADFARLAKQFSIAPEGDDGGLVGWVEKGTLEVFDQAMKWPVGSRGKILKSPYGYHIIEVLKKAPDGRLSFEEARARILAQLMEARGQKAFAAWLEQEVRKSKVFRNEELIRSIQVTTRGS